MDDDDRRPFCTSKEAFSDRCFDYDAATWMGLSDERGWGPFHHPDCPQSGLYDPEDEPVSKAISPNGMT